MSYQDHLKFAKDILRIRDAILSGEIYEGLPIGWKFSMNNTTKLHSIKYKSDRGSRIFGDINTSNYYISTDAPAPSVVTSKSIVYIHDGRDAYMTIGREQEVPILEYTEELHFQHSLLYSDEQLRAMVALSTLRFNPAPGCLRFKLFFGYVPVLAKLLRYKDYGII